MNSFELVYRSNGGAFHRGQIIVFLSADFELGVKFPMPKFTPSLGAVNGLQTHEFVSSLRQLVKG